MDPLGCSRFLLFWKKERNTRSAHWGNGALEAWRRVWAKYRQALSQGNTSVGVQHQHRHRDVPGVGAGGVSFDVFLMVSFGALLCLPGEPWRDTKMGIMRWKGWFLASILPDKQQVAMDKSPSLSQNLILPCMASIPQTSSTGSKFLWQVPSELSGAVSVKE